MRNNPNEFLGEWIPLSPIPPVVIVFHWLKVMGNWRVCWVDAIKTWFLMDWLYIARQHFLEMVNLNCQVKYCILDPLTKYIHMYLYLNINCIQGPPIVPTSPLGHFELQQLALFVLKSVSSVPIPISGDNGNSPCFTSIIQLNECVNDNLS